MPANRPRPVKLNAAPRTEARPPTKGKNAPRKRSSKSGSSKGNSSALTWTAIILGIILVGLVCAFIYVRSSSKLVAMAVPLDHPLALPEEETIQQPHVPAPVAPAPPKPVAVQPAPKPPVVVPPPPKPLTLKEKADEETQRLLGQTPTTKPAVPLVASAATTKPAAPAQPPVAQPVAAGQIAGVPARALPLDPNKLDKERIAAYQVALERIHFSCGFVDGDQGMRTQRMLRAYQTSRGLPVTGVLDQATRDSIGEPGEPFVNYTVTADDVASIMPMPADWKAKAAATRLGYNNMWEMLAEKFHCARSYLKALNPGVQEPVAGTEIIGPKVYPAAPIPHAASLRIYLGETEIEALDASGKIIAFFPCSIAKDKAKRPSGELTVKVVDPHPDYTFDPALFVEDAKTQNITHKMVLPPGPRNPVGTAWVGLSLPGYGIHGTPAPENISVTQSHGCFRLANWNADKVLKMVKVGTPVDVQP